MSMTKHEAIAEALHSQGYSCSQAVLAAFSDLANVDRDALLRLSAGLGGGIADLREVCGAVASGVLALDMIYAEGAPDRRRRAEVDYPRLRAFVQAFRDLNGAITCRELLGVEGAKRARPAGKTCHDMVMEAARLVDAYLAAHPPEAEQNGTDDHHALHD